jgi:hypothetical protein
MFGSHDLQVVLRLQDELRRDAAKQRLADRGSRQERATGRETRRVFGLRLSLA